MGRSSKVPESQRVLFFDTPLGPLTSQVERCYYFLHAFVETAQKKEPVDGRLVQFLLANPSNDGGQWDMLVNLIGEQEPCLVSCFFPSHEVRVQAC